MIICNRETWLICLCLGVLSHFARAEPFRSGKLVVSGRDKVFLVEGVNAGRDLLTTETVRKMGYSIGPSAQFFGLGYMDHELIVASRINPGANVKTGRDTLLHRINLNNGNQRIWSILEGISDVHQIAPYFSRDCDPWILFSDTGNNRIQAWQPDTDSFASIEVGAHRSDLDHINAITIFNGRLYFGLSHLVSTKAKHPTVAQRSKFVGRRLANFFLPDPLFRVLRDVKNKTFRRAVEPAELRLGEVISISGDSLEQHLVRGKNTIVNLTQLGYIRMQQAFPATHDLSPIWLNDSVTLATSSSFRGIVFETNTNRVLGQFEPGWLRGITMAPDGTLFVGFTESRWDRRPPTNCGKVIMAKWNLDRSQFVQTDVISIPNIGAIHDMLYLEDLE